MIKKCGIHVETDMSVEQKSPEILTDALDFDKGSALKDWVKVCGFNLMRFSFPK